MRNKEYILSEKLKEIAKLPTTNTINTLERKLLRIDIAQKIVNQGSYNKANNSFTNEVKNNKRIDFVIGISGGGKSSVLAKPISEKHNSIIIDSDFAKEMLPEYENGLGATRVHLESKLIFNLALKTALENNMNIVVAIVGKTLDSIKEIYNEAEKYGYEQHLHLNEVPPHIAAQRAMERFSMPGGRYVETSYILNEIGYKPTENYKILKEMGIYKSYEWYDNNVPFGDDPILIESIDNDNIANKQLELEKDSSFFIAKNEIEDDWDLEP